MLAAACELQRCKQQFAPTNTAGGCTPYTSLEHLGRFGFGGPAIAVAVTVTDANGCQAYATGELIEPALLESSGVPSTYACGTNVSCNGANDGSINVTVTGGASCTAYTFNWSNGATTEDVSNLTAGNYSVTITDANGCSTSSSFTLTEPALLVSSACGRNLCLRNQRELQRRE
ncbi:MAG: SprB repeat-containing protein [Bacteroidetes bacterium]|nr:SprB repeat-containing protein [Bacteroidota bacterium]